jgi:hypothetical protein
MIDDQLRHLPFMEGSPRIKRSEYTAWPLNHGDAHVTLWDDDKVAALTITIDDNYVSEHQTWLNLQSKYGLVYTWFCMTRKSNNWSSFQNLINHGHDVQSHTTNHVNYGDTNLWPNGPDSTELDSVYRLSVVDVNTNLNGGRCLTIAYPWGWPNIQIPSNAKYLEIANKYFIGARGVYGDINPADNINYMQTFNGFAGDTVAVASLFDKTKTVWGRTHVGDWLCCLYHSIGDLTKADKFCNFISKNSDKIWVTWFRNVILFGQERDSHTLTMRSVSDSKISFDLTDRMDDSIYNYPLTVKVRVNNDWGKITATQNGITIPIKVINHEGVMYVMLKAVPDRGLVEVNNGLSADVRSVGDESIRIIPIQNYLNIKGTVKGDLIEVYSLNGIKLKSVVAIGDESMIELNNGQIVLVKIRNKTYKVIL